MLIFLTPSILLPFSSVTTAFKPFSLAKILSFISNSLTQGGFVRLQIASTRGAEIVILTKLVVAAFRAMYNDVFVHN